eukprot:366041_1
MRKRRSGSLNETKMSMNAFYMDKNENKNRDVHCKCWRMRVKVECVIVLILLLITFMIVFALLMYYGHFILCYVNVGMCTPLIDLVTIAYQLSTNASSINVVTNDLEIDLLDYGSLCDLYALDQMANFKLVLLITYSHDEFKLSNMFDVLNNEFNVKIDFSDVESTELNDIYQEFILWKEENDGVYIKIVQLHEFKKFVSSGDMYKYIQCHQIGVLWLLNLEDDDINVKTMINNMMFFKYGGIRHFVFYYEHSHLPNYVNMLHVFLNLRS